jgi:excinuclease ABC subunit C
MAEENARLSLKASRQGMERTARVQERLKELYGLARAPVSIEGMDISTTGGSEAVGAVVHFHNGEPRRSRYRRYRIKTVEGMDDYAMIREVTLRRLKRGVEEKSLPDLILVDGGIGQVNSALAAAEELGVRSVDFLGIEKGASRAKAVAEGTDRIVSPRGETVLDAGAPELHLLQRVRDEAHRFAVTYHRKRRQKAGMSSPVDRVHGLGEKKKRALLTHFGGLKGLKKATREEIAKAPGIGPVLAERIHGALHA